MMVEAVVTNEHHKQPSGENVHCGLDFIEKSETNHFHGMPTQQTGTSVASIHDQNEAHTMSIHDFDRGKTYM